MHFSLTRFPYPAPSQKSCACPWHVLRTPKCDILEGTDKANGESQAAVPQLGVVLHPKLRGWESKMRSWRRRSRAIPKENNERYTSKLDNETYLAPHFWHTQPPTLQIKIPSVSRLKVKSVLLVRLVSPRKRQTKSGTDPQITLNPTGLRASSRRRVGGLPCVWPRRAETLKQPKSFSRREIDVNAKELSSHQTALALAA